MYLIYIWFFVCVSMFFNNPFLNALILLLGVPVMSFAVSYVQECCKLNKEEEKFLSLSQKIFE